MKKQINPTIKAHLIRGAFYLLLLLAVCAIPFALAQRKENVQRATGPATLPEAASGVVGNPNAPAPGCTDYLTSTGTDTIVLGTTDTGNHCDDCATSITLPFPVSVYGQTFTPANVGSNGSFDLIGAQSPFTHGCLTLPDSRWTMAIFGYQDDLRTDNLGFTGCAAFPGGTCGVFTATTGSAPNRIFYVEWRATHFADTTTSANFEVVFYENDN